MTAKNRSADPRQPTNGRTYANARRVAYSVAAGAASAGLAADAHAQNCAARFTAGEEGICWRQDGTISILQDTEEPFDNAFRLYMDYDPYYDIELQNFIFPNGNYQGAQVLYSSALGEFGSVVGFQGNFAYASALSVGDLIDATTTGSFDDVSLAYGATNPQAEFNDVQSAFIGVAFPIFNALHYGWVRVDINNAAGTFDILDLGYNLTPGEGILAGQVTTLASDANDNGVVDAADYTIWRDTQGSTTDLRADANGNGTVEPLDYVTWVGDFGRDDVFGPFTTMINASATAVPEPGTLGLLAAGSAGVAGLRRRRGQ
ncbi:MAG: PEP-CTERM sorting domain-containing protein [Planctomycetota bacterium]